MKRFDWAACSAMVLMVMVMMWDTGVRVPLWLCPFTVGFVCERACVMCACGQAGGRILWAWGGGAVSVHCKALKVIYV